MVDSHEVHSQIKLPDVFQKLKIFKLPQILRHRHQGWSRNSGGTTQENNNGKDDLLSSIAESLIAAVLNA